MSIFTETLRNGLVMCEKSDNLNNENVIQHCQNIFGNELPTPIFKYQLL